MRRSTNLDQPIPASILYYYLTIIITILTSIFFFFFYLLPTYLYTPYLPFLLSIS